MGDWARLLKNTPSVRHNGQSGNAIPTVKISACVSVGCRALHTLRSEKHKSSSAKQRSRENCISLNAGIFFPRPSPPHHHNHNHHHHHNLHVANMELNLLWTRPGLTHLEVPLMIAPDFLYLLVCSFFIFPLISYGSSCLYVATSLFCIPAFCSKLRLYLILLQFL